MYVFPFSWLAVYPAPFVLYFTVAFIAPPPSFSCIG